MRTSIFCLLIILILCSCSRKYYSNVDQVIPANVSLPGGMTSLVLLDRSKEENLGNRVDNLMNKGLIRSEVSKILLKDAGSQLPADISIYPKSLRHSNAGSPARELASAEVNKYAQEKDGLFALELFLAQEFRTFENIQKHQLDENGNDYILDAVRGTRVNSLKTQWTLYSKKSEIAALKFPYEVEEIFEAEGLTEQSVQDKLDSINVITVENMTAQIVTRIKADFNPMQVKSNWMYFSKGDKLVEQSGQYIKEGAFTKAIKIIKVNEQRVSNEKNQIRTLYNLATAFQLNRESDEAKKSIRNGLKKYNNKELKQLLGKIEKQRK